jgi:hypothetical protein
MQFLNLSSTLVKKKLGFLFRITLKLHDVWAGIKGLAPARPPAQMCRSEPCEQGRRPTELGEWRPSPLLRAQRVACVRRCKNRLRSARHGWRAGLTIATSFLHFNRSPNLPFFLKCIFPSFFHQSSDPPFPFLLLFYPLFLKMSCKKCFKSLFLKIFDLFFFPIIHPGCFFD